MAWLLENCTYKLKPVNISWTCCQKVIDVWTPRSAAFLVCNWTTGMLFHADHPQDANMVIVVLAMASCRFKPLEWTFPVLAWQKQQNCGAGANAPDKGA
jgi:hypothetical protein